MRFIAARLLPLIAVPVFPFAPLGAQDPPPAASAPVVPIPEIRPGEVQRGTIGIGDPSVDGRYYHVYRLALDVGQSVQIDLDSSDFDTFLELLGPYPNSPHRTNDDRGDGDVNSRLLFMAEVPGDYQLRVASLFQRTGAYVLSVRALPPEPPPIAIVGGEMQGAIGDSSALRAGADDLDHPRRYQLYTFDAPAGEGVQLDMRSTALDSALELADADGRLSVVDDNSGGGRNARIVTVIPRTARYLVRALAPGGQSGRYVLTLARIARPAAGPVQTLSRDVSVPGTLALDAEAEMYPDGSGLNFLYRLYTLSVRAGEFVTVQMSSDDFTPVLDAGTLSVLGYATAMSETGRPGTPGGGTEGPSVPARLDIWPQRNGEIVLRAHALGPGRGRFTLSTTTVPPD